MDNKNTNTKGKALEVLLMQHPFLTCVKIKREQNKQIVYFVSKKSRVPKRFELRQYLKSMEVDNLDSTIFVEVPSLEKAEETSFSVSFSTVTEELVAEIWGIWGDKTYTSVYDLFSEKHVVENMIEHLRETFEVDISADCILDVPICEVAEYIDAQLESSTPAKAALDKQKPVVLSSAQQRIWFWEQLIPNTTVYSVPAAYKLTGKVELTRLYHAFEHLIHRHPILRVTFRANEDGIPEQHLHTQLSDWFFYQDLREEAQPEKFVESCMLHDLEQTFDLLHGPLFRIYVYQLKNEWRLLILAHHLVIDGWSLGVLVRDLAALYDGIQLPANEIDYLDYAAYEQGKDWEKEASQLAYWKGKLQNLPMTRVPTDYPRCEKESYRGSSITKTFSSHLVRKLHQVAQSTGSSLYMVLLTAFQLLLSRYGGGKDIVVGSPVAGRFQSEWEKVIGFFVNTIVLRTDLSGNPTWDQLIGRVKDTVLDAFSHQEVPFDKVVEAVSPDRQTSLSPIFQAMFVLQNMDLDTAMDSSIQFEPILLSQSIAKFDLTLTMLEKDEELRAILEYNSDLFAATTIERMLEQLELLLVSMTSDRNSCVHQVSIQTENEKKEALEWHHAEKTYEEQSIPVLFERQAQQNPHAIAMQLRGECCTYQELNYRANQVARYLSAQGIGAGDRIGICFERSMELYISMIAIVKLGAVYVPFDVQYPKERFAYLLSDAKLSLALTSAKFQDRFQDVPFSMVIWEQMDLREVSTSNYDSLATIDSLVYVMYTSGSTGQPKGVEITARGIVRLVQKPNYMEITPDDVFLQLAPVAFDAATLEIWGCFLNGAKLVIMPPEIPSLEEISDVIVQNQITTLWLTAGLFRLMVEEHLSSLLGLRYLITGGDVVSASHVKQILAHNGPQVINGYGPTENTTFTCCYPIPADWHGDTSVPIGRPINGTYVYILDDNRMEVPLGVPGELYIGGDGLALGYANRPELTAEKFVTIAGKGRLYRSGDLVRLDQDGLIHFVGRMDHQVKIRGFRVELGEIEAVMTTHPAVSDVVVLAKETRQGDKQLVAYLKTNKKSDWKAWLESKFPAYMIPSNFIELSTFPLTSNGKVDRKKLAAQYAFINNNQQPDYHPVSKEEKQLYRIWSEVLGHDHFGIQDNFFSIGGHSLLATQVIARIQKNCGVSLPLQSIFTKPTIETLAPLLQQQARNPLLFSKQVEKPREIPASFGQKRLWFFEQYASRRNLYRMPIVLEVKGKLVRDKLEESYRSLLQRHTALRTTFYFEDGQLYQRITEPSDDCFQYEDLRLYENPIEKGNNWINQVLIRDLDLTEGPLAKLCVYQLADEHWYLLFDMHHIVSDGVSLQILTDEFFQYYQGKEVASLSIQYADYALQEQEWMKSEEIVQELNYWKEQLSDLPVLDLPTDHPRGQEQTFTGATYSVTLPEAVRTGLAQISQQHGMTFYMTTLAVFQTLLSRYTGATDIAVGSPVAGRSQVEWESLIGFFVNTLVFRNDLSGEPTWNEVLERVKTTAIEAYAHSSVPFERVVEEVAPNRHLSHSPLFQVMFSVENEAWQAPEVPGLMIEEVALPQTTTKFDLALHVAPWEQGMNVTFSYNTDLWEEETIARMAGHLHQLMQHLIDHPETSITHATLLTETEKQEQLAWNGGKEALPFVSVVEQVARVVAATPDAPAIVAEEATYTYQQFWQEATQLAHYLQKRGIGRGKVVALCSDRSPAMLVGMLAILQTGATYLPIDPHYPADRIRYLLQDAGVQLVLTGSQVEIDVPAVQLLSLDTGYVDWMGEATTPLNISIAAADTAYLIYTSGSTGQPKGVAVSHASLSHLIHWHRTTYLKGEDRSTWIAGVAFDASVWEIWPALASGVALYLPEETLRLDPVGLWDWLIDKEITVSFVPTPLLEQLLRLEWPTKLALRYLLTGGDQLRIAPPEGFPIEVVNHYG
ncbi:amino acid adenylation domain-containing protein, partial [Shimazuella sp. AN120528]|uniref:non-ribosomal peptide synthetase n=1 Tax=Shimazuella soli TaxID=1892854 RepID=UPI001F0D56BC|nr:amino acid adenylation domain-containing protein [Shimazuella soli]